MKKGGIILGSAGLALVAGYGAWNFYKKKNPGSANNLKKELRKATKNFEKTIEDMM